MEKADRCPVSNRRDIEGSVESVAEEVASFGSDVRIIEPGGARMQSSCPSILKFPPIASCGWSVPKNGLAPSDPDQMAGRISKRVNVEPPPLRLVLGSQGLGGTLTTRLANTIPVRTTDRTRRFDGLSARSVTPTAPSCPTRHLLLNLSAPTSYLSKQIIQ